MASGQLRLAGVDPGVTIYAYDRHGRLVDVIEDVSLGDRHETAAEGRESLHTACLWAYVSAKFAERDHPPEPADPPPEAA